MKYDDAVKYVVENKTNMYSCNDKEVFVIGYNFDHEDDKEEPEYHVSYTNNNDEEETYFPEEVPTEAKQMEYKQANKDFEPHNMIMTEFDAVLEMLGEK